MSLNLITDRTQLDVDSQNTKGTYDYRDLNRVDAAVTYLGKVFSDYGYSVALTTFEPWTEESIPTKSAMSAYLKNVSELRSVLAMLPTTPETPKSMELLTYISANDIEKILLDIEIILMSMGQEFIRADMPWAVAGNEVYVRND